MARLHGGLDLRWARAAAHVLPLALLLLAPWSGADAEGEAAVSEQRVRVFYPRGQCETGLIEIEVFDRERLAWRPHPEHPRIRADGCELEDPGRLLQEIRYRCVDPASPGSVSDWLVGVQVFPPREVPGCEPGAPES